MAIDVIAPTQDPLTDEQVMEIAGGLFFCATPETFQAFVAMCVYMYGKENTNRILTCDNVPEYNKSTVSIAYTDKDCKSKELYRETNEIPAFRKIWAALHDFEHQMTADEFTEFGYALSGAAFAMMPRPHFRHLGHHEVKEYVTDHGTFTITWDLPPKSM